MNRKLNAFLFVLALNCFLVFAAQAQTTAFTYQGRLTDGANPANGTYDMQFKLCDSATGAICNQTGATITNFSVQVANGVFAVQLNDSGEFGASAFTGADRFLEINVRLAGDAGNYQQLLPRQRITSTPYAIRSLSAANADTAATATSATNFSGTLSGDVTGTQNATVVNAVGGKTASAIAASVTDTTNAASANTASAIVKRDASGNFSAGTITASLSGNATTATTATNFSGSLSGDVTGTQSATVVGKLQGRAVANTAPTNGQVLKFNGTQWAPGADNDTNTTYTAGSGLTLSGTIFSANFGGNGSATTVSRSDHTHVGQVWTCSTTNCSTLDLETNDTGVGTAALFARANSATTQGVGIWGITQSTSDQSAGIFGQASATTGGAKGVWGEANGTTGIAVYGHGINGAIAAQFDGNVAVNGSLSKLGGSFKIDDPLDPQNKYLYHSFVESPDMKNIYDGNATTDEKGEAIVTLPAWFEALNRDFRYQLTVIGQFAQAIIAEEINGNRFKIKTDKPGVKVSWQVTGIRHDKYAEENRIPVEEDKTRDEKGKCLYAPACKSESPMTPLARPRGEIEKQSKFKP